MFSHTQPVSQFSYVFRKIHLKTFSKYYNVCSVLRLSQSRTYYCHSYGRLKVNNNNNNNNKPFILGGDTEEYSSLSPSKISIRTYKTTHYPLEDDKKESFEFDHTLQPEDYEPLLEKSLNDKVVSFRTILIKELIDIDTSKYNEMVLSQGNHNGSHSIIGTIKETCVNGIPQVTLPTVVSNRGKTRKPKIDGSGCPWLRCPILTSKLNQWEHGKNSQLKRYEDMIQEDKSLREELEEYNRTIPDRRKALVTAKAYDMIMNDDRFHHMKKSFNTGLIGTTSVYQVKCLHAHLADFLLFKTNPLGKRIYNDLKSESFPINGNQQCKQFCVKTITKEINKKE